MLILHNISYNHPDKTPLFTKVNIAIDHKEKIALVGNNGSGKSTLLKIISGQVLPSSGTIQTDLHTYMIPQHFGQYDHLSVAEALDVSKKINALQQLLQGNTIEENYTILDDDWEIEERCKIALDKWQVSVSLSQKMNSLSGGQKTKIFLSGIDIHNPNLILMDEPSNHLDLDSRKQLYHFIKHYNNSLILVSHDRKLLNTIDTIYEISSKDLKRYGGNYDFYKEQKELENISLNNTIKETQKELQKARDIQIASIERKQKLDARGKSKQQKSGVARIMMNTLRNNAESSTARLKSAQELKNAALAENLQELRNEIPEIDMMKLRLQNATKHAGKLLIKADAINYCYHNTRLWSPSLSFEVFSGDRIAIAGANGSGKTTLLNLILSKMIPQQGAIIRNDFTSVYIDQDYSLIDDSLTVYEQVQLYNTNSLVEHEMKIKLHHFLFLKEDWDKKCNSLSGGEKMKLSLCCISITNKSPDVIILDEPTNNLDIQNMNILSEALKNYQGTLLVVSHDSTFLEDIGITQFINL